MPGEADDLIGKIKDCLQKEGFSYNGESIRTAVYSPETSYAQMGLFMTYMLIRLNIFKQGIQFISWLLLHNSSTSWRKGQPFQLPYFL